MTALTQSGFPVIDDYGDPALDVHATCPGTKVEFPGGIRKGDVTTILLYVASRWNQEIEPLKGPDKQYPTGQCWGYDKRDIRGGTGWSNHAGGCAIDINAAEHPQHARTLSQAQIDAGHRILAAVSPVVRWGADWTPASLDQQPWEIAPGMAGTGKVEALAAKIRAGGVPNVPPELLDVQGHPGGTSAPSKPTQPSKPSAPKAPAYPLPAGYYYGPLSGPNKCISGLAPGTNPAWIAGLKAWQQRMKDRGWTITPDGHYGPQTAGVVRAFKAEKHIGRDRSGNIGRVVYRAAWTEPIT